MAWGAPSGASQWVGKLRDNDAKLSSLFVMSFRKLSEKDWIDICAAAEDNTALKELMASGHELSPASLQAFSTLLERNKGITKLGVGSEKLGDSGVSILTQGLAKNTALKTMEMDMKSITCVGASALAQALEQNRVLEKLNLARNPLGDDGVHAICEGLEKSHGTLQDLDLTEASVGDGGVLALSKLLEASTCGLVTLNLAGNEAIKAASNAAMWTSLSVGGGRRLKSIVMAGCVNAWDAESATKMAEALTAESCGLKDVVLDGAPFGRLGVNKQVCAALASSKTLETISLKNCEVGDAGMASFAERFAEERGGQIKTLTLTSNNVTADGLLTLLLCSKQKIHALNLFDNVIGDEGIRHVASTLSEAANHDEVSPSLVDLDLGANKLTEASVMCLLNALRSMPKMLPALRTLGLGAHDAICGESTEWEDCVDALRKRSTPLDVIWQVGHSKGGKEAEMYQEQAFAAMAAARP